MTDQSKLTDQSKGTSVADGTAETKDARKDDPERRPGILGGAPAVADDGDVAFGGMAGIAVLAAILVSMLALAGFFGYNPPETSAAPAPTTEAPAEETTTTEAAEEEEAAPAVVPADAVVDATNDSIVLAGTVPSEEAAESIRAAAAEHYTADQIDDQLVVEEGADPYTLTVNGTLDSGDVVDGLGESLGAAGLGTGFVNNLELSEQAGVVSALNELVQLEPILFESGTDVIIAESQATLDEAAEILKSFPEAAVEVGGHTDSRGDDASNQSLSQLRADAVVAALQARDVTNDLTSVGYGETQLKENPDDTPEQQQINRRIEFTLL